MCGRFVLEVSPDTLMKGYGLVSVPHLSPRYNIAPSQKIAVVRQCDDDKRALDLLQWGLIPSWAQDPSIGGRMINARSETVHEKPSFRKALRSRRCVIPASGFYEWERTGKEKIPHYIHLRDEALMSFAGLWESWTSPQGESLATCTILTTGANRLIKSLHNRMPVILHNHGVGLWLDREIEDVNRLAELYTPYPSERLEEYLVSKDVNSPTNDSPNCIIAV